MSNLNEKSTKNILMTRVVGASALALVAGGALFSANAAAEQQPDYTYIGLSAEDNNDYPGADTGLRLDLSYELQDRYFVGGYFRSLGNDGFNNNNDFYSFAVEGGRYFGLADGLTADITGKVGRVDYDIDHSNFYGVAGNLRQRIGMFEVHGGIGWVDYTSAGSDTQYVIGGRAFITPDLAVGVDYNESEFGDGWMLTARYHW